MKIEELLSEYARLPEYLGFDTESVSVSSLSTFGNFPINIASARGRVDEVKLLLESGSDINQIGEHGYTPLHEAVEQGCIEVAKLLLARGADTKIKNDNGDTARAASVIGQGRTNGIPVTSVRKPLSHFVHLADPNTSIMLQQRINVCFGKAAPQRAGPTRMVVLGRSCDFAKYTFCS